MSSDDLIYEPISKRYQNEWTEELIQHYTNILHGIAVDEWGYDIYPNQIEIVSADGMLETYSSHGMPIYYQHWSFGKDFLANQRAYNAGRMGLAYEMVINSDPCIAYLMEENSLTMQVFVVAHASFGHNHFFKNNYLFKQWTEADAIVDYLRFAKRYIQKCEDRYGVDAVEEILDAAHTMQFYAVDKYKRGYRRRDHAEQQRKKRLRFEEEQYNLLMLPELDPEEPAPDEEPKVEATDNLLYFIEKNSQNLKKWQREILRIVRKTGEYFWPNVNTKLMNEGFATYTHCKLIEELDKRKLVDPSFMLEFAHVHSNVVNQPDMALVQNPYALGLAIFRDIERIVTNPTQEDRDWFPKIAGTKDYWKVIFEAVASLKDESFILQYLSPKVIRDFRMFSLKDDDVNSWYYTIGSIHNEEGYRNIRKLCAQQFDFNCNMPRIEITDVRWKEDRRLILRHTMHRDRPLEPKNAEKVLAHINTLWGFPVEIVSVNAKGEEVQKFIHKPMS